MNRYAYATFAGTGVFFLQLAIVAQPQLDALNEKSGELVIKALTEGGSTPTFLALGYYLALGLACHVLPLLLVAKIYSDFQSNGPGGLRTTLEQRGAFTLSLLAMLAAMVIANAAFFPQSSAFPNRPIEVAVRAWPWLLPGIALLTTAIGVYWLARFASGRSRALAALVLLLGAVAWTTPMAHEASLAPTADRTQPDIIIIGVDSLRPDHLTSYGFPGPSLTPAIDRFVAGAARYRNAYTTQGRTFIAYMSILSGQYPVHHGARENLYPLEDIHREDSIAHHLKARGYQTVFAMDEARFANFDEGYGFDVIASPPPGILDFGAGAFLDTVGTNLLQLAPYSDVFLPHVAGNRAANTTYRPEAHSRRVARAIRASAQSKPLFLASHFCMAHVPFAPADTSLPIRAAPFDDSPLSYQTALRVADSQVQTLLETLQEKGRLDNAIVILLSDHGEGLGMDKDRWSKADGRAIPAYYGHGMPALDMSQSRILLAVQRYREGRPTLEPGLSEMPTSLIDVAPTAFALAGVPALQGFDGMTLFNTDGSPAKQSSGRPIFVESGVSGTSLQNPNIDNGDVVNEFSHLYEITENHRFELAPGTIPSVLAAKQRAVVIGDMGISTIPAGQMGSEPCWLTLNLTTNQVECFLQDADDAAVAVGKMLICDHFSGDTMFHKKWCASMKPSKRLLARH